MKQICIKKLWTVLISVSVIGGIVFACAGGDWPEYGNSNFTPEAFVEKKYSPFFYSTYTYYYGIGHETNQVSRFNEINVSDWSAYLGKDVPTAGLQYLLNEASRFTVDSIVLFCNASIKALPQSVKDYLWLKKGAGKKVKEFVQYLALAKEAEVFSNTVRDWWDDAPRANHAYSHAGKLNKALEAGMQGAGDLFLQQRYWFQLVRSYFFNGDLTNAIALFEKMENRFEKNRMYYRTQCYAAGAYYKQKNYARANYYYSLVFEGCDELKTAAHFSFHPQEQTDWNATLGLCKNSEEKITLWQMLGVFYGDEKRSIREIYALNPRSDKLTLLLARAVNKEEQKLYAEDYRFEPTKAIVVTYDSELLALVLSIADSKNSSQPFMWNAAAGYLQMLHKHYTEADAQLQLAAQHLPNQPLAQWQLRLLQVLNKVAAADTITPTVENNIVADIEWLRTINSEAAGDFRYAHAFEFIKSVMAQKYAKQGDTIKSECFVSKAGFYTDNNNVEAMKFLLQKSHVDGYESLCRNLYNKTLADLYDYQGVKHAYDNNITEAIKAMEKAGGKASLPFAGNPFNGKIKDCFECDHAAYKGTPYTKQLLLTKMNEMQQNIQLGNDVYNNALLLGNAFYNISYYGNARSFYLSSIPGSYQYSSNSLDSTFSNFLLSMDKAKFFYTKALAASTTNEQKAKCHYLLAKCERNDWYTKNVFNSSSYYGSDMVDVKAISHFKLLSQYSDTKYYQEVIKECGYFRTFIKMH